MVISCFTGGTRYQLNESRFLRQMMFLMFVGEVRRLLVLFSYEVEVSACAGMVEQDIHCDGSLRFLNK